MMFEPRDPDFEQRTRQSFLDQGFMRTLGAQMSHLEPGGCRLTVDFSDNLAQQHGYFHGGVVAALADVSGGFAAYSLLPPDLVNLTVEFKLNLLSPGLGQSLTADAVVLKPGRTLTVCRSEVFIVASDGTQKLCAAALATYMAVHVE